MAKKTHRKYRSKLRKNTKTRRRTNIRRKTKTHKNHRQKRYSSAGGFSFKNSLKSIKNKNPFQKTREQTYRVSPDIIAPYVEKKLPTKRQDYVLDVDLLDIIHDKKKKGLTKRFKETMKMKQNNDDVKTKTLREAFSAYK